MAREKTRDLLSQMIPTKDTRTPDESSTEDTQRTHVRSTKATLKRYDVRFDPEDWEQLKRHFHTKGLTVSAGIRMVLLEYLERH